MNKRIHNLKFKRKNREILNDFMEVNWSQYADLIDGWIPKFSFFIPLLGYLILFNDQILDFFEISQLTGAEEGSKNIWRFRVLYFGLILLGVSNIIYIILKPSIFKVAIDENEFVSKCLETFSFEDFQKIKMDLNWIEHKDHWEVFRESFFKYSDKNYQPYSIDRSKTWCDLKKINEEFLIDLLKSGFRYYDSRKKLGLCFCIGLSSLGYLLLAIPSIDVFIRVIFSMI